MQVWENQQQVEMEWQGEQVSSDSYDDTIWARGILIWHLTSHISFVSGETEASFITRCHILSLNSIFIEKFHKKNLSDSSSIYSSDNDVLPFIGVKFYLTVFQCNWKCAHYL